MAVYFQKREVVVPGQLLAEGRYRASFGTYDDGDKIYSALVGLAELRGNTVKVVALEGVYIPREGDLVLGTITMVTGNNWKVDVGGPYLASLHANNALRRPYDDDISRYMDIGDVVAAEVIAFDRVTGPFLGMKGRGLRRLDSGMILNISPAKIPRVIGRRGSMINMIQDILRIQTMVGQNGRIWIRTSSTEVMRLAIKAFKMIETQAHTSKLTDRVKTMLEEEMAKIGGGEHPEDVAEEPLDIEDSGDAEEIAEPVEEAKEKDTAEGEKPVVPDEPPETEVVDEAKDDSPKDGTEKETESEEKETETKEEVSE
ncbi:MAG: exosome complex RNA-binding protein Rrp4 [Candidatus Thorarchaeota archaeon]